MSLAPPPQGFRRSSNSTGAPGNDSGPTGDTASVASAFSIRTHRSSANIGVRRVSTSVFSLTHQTQRTRSTPDNNAAVPLPNGNGDVSSPHEQLPPSIATSNAAGATAAAATGSTSSNYRVFVRIRPFLPNEMDPKDNCFPIPPVEVRGGNECLFIDATTGMPRDVFHFDGCFCSITHKQWERMTDLVNLPKESLPTFPPVANQEDVFAAVGRPLVDAVMDGFNASVLAYGQTSSGKTHTMMGTPQNEGLIPRIARAILDEVQLRSIPLSSSGGDALAANDDSAGASSTASPAWSPQPNTFAGSPVPTMLLAPPLAPPPGVLSRDYAVEVSFFEIYNETILDLLQQGATQHRRRKVRVHPVMGVYVEGLTYQRVTSWSQCIRLLQKGLQQRHTASTKMNEMSSRSHAVFQLRLQQTDMTDLGPVMRRSNAYLADLAGSERIKQSAVEGERFKEATQINLSLTTLRRVIDALISAQSQSSVGSPSFAAASPSGGSFSITSPGSNAQSTKSTNTATIPYRESMLTWVLSDSLGGNAKACMIATLCPHPTYADETYQTLQYANRAKSIVNVVVKNEDQMAKMLKQLQEALMQANTLHQQQQSSAVNASPSHTADDDAEEDDLTAAASEHRQKRTKNRSGTAMGTIQAQESLIASLREEQMLMLTKYADIKDAYDALKDDFRNEADEHERARLENTRLSTRCQEQQSELRQLRAEIARLSEVNAKLAVESEHHSAVVRDLRAHDEATLGRLRKCEQLRDSLVAERDLLTQQLEAAQDKCAAEGQRRERELTEQNEAHRQALAAQQNMMDWCLGTLHTLWEASFASRRTALIQQIATTACDWATQALSRGEQKQHRVDELEARICEMEFVNQSQDRALSQVAQTFIAVRETLQRVHHSDSVDTMSTEWTVNAVVALFKRFYDSCRSVPSIPLRADTLTAAPLTAGSPRTTRKASASSRSPSLRMHPDTVVARGIMSPSALSGKSKSAVKPAALNRSPSPRIDQPLPLRR